MKVQEIMTTDVRTCGPESTLADAAMIMWDTDCGIVPVVNSAQQVVGTLTDRDICMAVATQNRLASAIHVGEISTGHVCTCQPDDDVRDALDIMRDEQLRRLPVTDETGRLVGILSLSDIVRHAKKGESKKQKHISHKDVMRTLKALSKPGLPPAGEIEDIADEAAEAAETAEVAEAAVSDL
jgi:CBS-domain-containing membrane protein